jgi:hypothetical protein
MQLNWFLKSKFTIEDLNEQITNWRLIWTLTRFCRLFLLNETARFVQNGAISSTVHKKRTQNGAVLNDTVCLLLPLDVQKTREESFCSPVFTDFSSSEKHQKDADQGHPLTKLTRGLPRVGETKETCLLGQSWGGCTMIAPSISLPCFCL